MHYSEFGMIKSLSREITIFIAQGAYAGRFPFAPGTAGTAAAVPLYLLLKGLPPAGYLIVCLVAVAIAVVTAGAAEKLLGQKDAPSIVIDEIAGYLVAMALLPSNWPFIISGFFLFRLFDIIKPFPLKRLQDLHGGPGVVLDDIGAGVYTNLVLQIAGFVIGK